MTNQEFSWTGKYVGTLDGGKDLSADSFFTKTDYNDRFRILFAGYSLSSLSSS